MGINEARRVIELFLKQSNQIFNKDETDVLVNCFHMMMYHINLLENDDKLEGPLNEKLVNSAMMLISTKILKAGLSLVFREFIESYIYVIYNYNSNVLKNKNIELLCALDNMIISLYTESANTAKVMRDVHNHYMDIRNWMPPAFSISKAYLEELLNTNQELLENDNSDQEE